MTRRKHDFYPTEDWAMDVLASRVPIANLAEPCVGAGDLVKRRPDVLWTNDVDEARPATYHLNAASPAAWRTFPRCSWVTTNPPFNRALMILRLALQHADLGVAFLLRLSFLEPTKVRAPFFARHRPDRLIVLPRMSFTRDGKTDSVTCAWMVWGTGQGIERGVESVSPTEVALRELQPRLPGVEVDS